MQDCRRSLEETIQRTKVIHDAAKSNGERYFGAACWQKEKAALRAGSRSARRRAETAGISLARSRTLT